MPIVEVGADNAPIGLDTQTTTFPLRARKMNERREHSRETTLVSAVSGQIRLPSGKMLDGSVYDLSERGAKIVGDTAGLTVGVEVNLMLLLPLDVKIGYGCRVKHIDPDGKSWGARFTSKVWLIPSQ
jgi:hypothetical protein